MSDVEVVIGETSSQTDPSSSHLEYRVRNTGERPLWLVDDGWLTWNQHGRQIDLSFARAKLQKGAQVFGYFPPAVVPVEAGQEVSRTVDLRWPQELSRLWNERDEAAPEPGRYDLSVRVGYGLSPSPEEPQLGEDVEAPVFRWQHEAASPPAPLEVPSYPRGQH